MKDTLARNTMVANRLGYGISGSPPLVTRTLFQLPGGLLFAVYLPVVTRWQFDVEIVTSPSMANTIFGTGLALIIGYYFYRSLTTFPGVRALSYIMPTFVAAFMVMLIAFFFLRLDYSRFQFASSFGLTLLWFYGVNLFADRTRPYRLAVVPGADIGLARSSRNHVAFAHLQEPHLGHGEWGGVVADLRANLDEKWERFIADCAISGIPVFHVKQVRESLTGRVEIEHLSENNFGSLIPNLAYVKIKQVIDWIAALVVLPFLLPVFAVVAFLIRRDSPGPIFFTQERMGYQGHPFTVYKFRTMTVDGAKGELDDAITKSDDERITELGRVLRRTRIDELPQVFNILRGEMSWIGPRPEANVLSKWYENELAFYRYRHIVRPGITGWAQVNQGHVADVDEVLEKLHFDFYYIKYFSPWLDVLIVLRTIHTMITGFGAR
jgi:lipopolysaccharide/colanic/teichoic acid biosynthesis glycosyltransferase